MAIATNQKMKAASWSATVTGVFFGIVARIVTMTIAVPTANHLSCRRSSPAGRRNRLITAASDARTTR